MILQHVPMLSDVSSHLLESIFQSTVSIGLTFAEKIVNLTFFSEICQKWALFCRIIFENVVRRLEDET